MEIVPFMYGELAVRTIVRGDDQWFVAKDVCRIAR
jgi:prophage antirepressor-like protein